MVRLWSVAEFQPGTLKCSYRSKAATRLSMPPEQDESDQAFPGRAEFCQSPIKKGVRDC